MDFICLTGIRCYGYVGYLSEEQVLGQWFEVDLKLYLDLTKASRSDAITDTLDYRHIINFVQDLVKTARFALLEKLAGAIAEAILATDNFLISQIQVIVTKPNAPIPDFGGRISIQITRYRE